MSAEPTILGPIIICTYLHFLIHHKLLQINTAPTFSIIKTGKDDLKVKDSTFYMKRLDNGKSTKYTCGGFEIKGDCNKLICTHTFSSCRKSTVGKFYSIKKGD